MITAIISILLTFILTGLFGNWILQRWQQRNWLRQQGLLAEQKNYENLRELCDAILELSNVRINKMRRLLAVLSGGGLAIIEQRLKQYDAALEDWNKSLGIFSVKLRFYAAYDMATRLEENVQRQFSAAGKQLEQLTRKRCLAGTVSSPDIRNLEQLLNDLNGSVIAFNRDLLQMLNVQKNKTYYGTELYLSPYTLKNFPTWELVKALFKPRIERPRIVRPPGDT